MKGRRKRKKENEENMKKRESFLLTTVHHLFRPGHFSSTGCFIQQSDCFTIQGSILFIITSQLLASLITLANKYRELFLWG
jgi:hypothetical protein